jgi:ethanolamine ammonia-lyase large subunit
MPTVRPLPSPRDLRLTLTLANELKEGDLLVGGGTDPELRADARRALESTTLGTLDATVLVEDGVGEALARGLNQSIQSELAARRVGQVRDTILGDDGAAWVARYRGGLSSIAIAAVVKVMDNDQLSTVARKLFTPLPGRGIRIGSAGHFGSRIQPNSPGDDEREILFSILEGLTYGCGDVILGINPAADDVETIGRLSDLLARVVERLGLPTRTCVLSDIIKQTAARQHTRIDVGFQSLAGTSRALAGMVGLDIDGLLDLARGFDGLYFETGQGAEVTNGAAEGVDMVTLESRTYGVARLLQQATGAWTIVNDVAGFIGPEVFRTEDQLLRACLEDSVMAKLHGLTMGLDVCATFHMGIAPSSLQRLTGQIAESAAPAYLMAVAGNADPMLGYLTTAFRQHPGLRARCGRQPTTAMATWAEAWKAPRTSKAAAIASLYARYQQAGGDTRSHGVLGEEARRELGRLQALGWDLGYEGTRDGEPPAHVETRLQSIYDNARRALYARVDPAVLRDVSPRHLAVRTRATNREEYLRHPRTGERIGEHDVGRLAAMYPVRRPTVQIVLSDGLNAHALSENLRGVLPAVRQVLAEHGVEVGEVDVVVQNGRVRAGYHIGGILGVEGVVHLIGERPGTGINTMSAYLTYGRDTRGHLRWSPDLDHADTTAICGIHRVGKSPAAAAGEIVRAVERMLGERRSGVARGRAPSA